VERHDLDRVLGTWSDDAPEYQRQVGLILLIENAEIVREPAEVGFWYEQGVRLIGPAWHSNRYTFSDKEPGPLTDLGRELLDEMDRYGNKAELIERVVNSDIRPSEVLNDLDRSKLSDMCRLVGIKTSGTKSELIERLIEFYDDLTFEERATQDAREEWYSNYELLATRSYSDLRAKKLISKDLEIEHQFEQATDFLFEMMLNVPIDVRRQVTKCDGRIPLENNQCILWDCKCAEGPVNLQDHLEDQFDAYLRKERENGHDPLAFLVIAPSFTPQSIKLAHQYKARTNWDVALVTAEALKHLAEQWSTASPGKPFPVRLFNRTDLIDKERADFLLSLA
jgi:hypothetical protein